MRSVSQLAITFVAMSLLPGCQSRPAAVDDSPADSERLVEAACGQCQFSLPGKGCDLAVRIEGTAYFVDGTGIDDHGDAHASEGLCNAVRMARVTGSIVDGRFHATSFELVPVASAERARDDVTTPAR